MPGAVPNLGTEGSRGAYHQVRARIWQRKGRAVEIRRGRPGRRQAPSGMVGAMAQVNPAYEAVVQLILAKLQKKGAARRCAMCGKTAWVLGQYVTLTVVSTPGAVPLPNPYMFRPVPPTNYPMVAIFCSNCGNTHLINLLVLGFTENEFQQLTFPPLD